MPDQLCTLSTDDLSLGVAPLGAEMQYLRTASGQDLLWHGDAAHWAGRAPVLFPIVGRAVDDIVSSGGVTAEMKQHGLARRLVFELEHATDTQCTHVLRASEETKAVYPFDFRLSVMHELNGASLTVSVEVSNEGASPMPFGFGFHPAFCWPLPDSDAAHHVRLKDAENLKRRPLRPDGLLEFDMFDGPFKDGVLTVNDDHFADGALVFPNGAQPLRYGAETGLVLDFTFENLPDLALWRPVGAPFLCIEPWHGTASLVGDGPNIAERPNSLTLAPGTAARFGYRVDVSAASE
ncbi:MAG: aldose 1-epimerase family protein [Rhodobacteraceae bacterium]|nr:aldose 1-epimerase family protein [Paracoccaceae bacterium]